MAALLVAASPALAGDAKGRFVVKGGKTSGTIAPTHAAAYVDARPSRPAEQRSSRSLLSEAAIDVDAAVATLQPHTHVINQDVLDDRNYVLLWVAADGHVSMNATFSQTMTQFLDKVGRLAEGDAHGEHAGTRRRPPLHRGPRHDAERRHATPSTSRSTRR